MLGFDALGRLALGELSRPATGHVYAVLAAAGTSVFTAVSYAFYADAERACLHQEIVTALVSPEDKIVIVPFEDRVYRTPSEARGAGNQPRKRIC